MNTFTLFALVICAVFAMVSAVPNPAAPADTAVDGPEAIPAHDLLEGAESRGYGYRRRGGGGGGYYGGGHHGGGHHGGGYHGGGHHGGSHYHHG